jgi:hypothetical protein
VEPLGPSDLVTTPVDETSARLASAVEELSAALATAIRQLGSTGTSALERSLEEPFIYKCPGWLEESTFRDAVKNLARCGKGYRAGRRMMVRPQDLVDYFLSEPTFDRRQLLDTKEPIAEFFAESEGPLPFKKSRKLQVVR